jgi:hypothetical protein
MTKRGLAQKKFLGDSNIWSTFEIELKNEFKLAQTISTRIQN